MEPQDEGLFRWVQNTYLTRDGGYTLDPTHEIDPPAYQPPPPEDPAFAAITDEELDEELARREAEASDAELAKRSLKVFVHLVWHIIEPKQELRWNWHLDVLCSILESVTRKEIKRLIVNVPPGTMKTLLINVFWPAWEWANDPSLRYLTASYIVDRTIDSNKKVRDIVQSEWYQRYFDVRLAEDQNVKIRYNTTQNGWRIATSVGGLGTGEHPDRVIIDDPVTATDARSKVSRKACNDWFDQTISSRGVARDVVVILVMQRLHLQDLTAHLLAKGGWEHVKFPMRYEKERKDADGKVLSAPDPRDQRTVEGELLWPELFDEKKVKQLEIDLGPYGAAGQLQQRPSPEGGGLFKREWFTIVDAAPKRARRARGWDTAATEGDGDYTCGVKIAEENDAFYVEDVVRGQWSPGVVDTQIISTTRQDGKLCAQREEQEKGSAGKGVTGARGKALKGYNYLGVPITGDKEVKCLPFRAQCEQRNVFLVRGNWNQAFLDELESFPTGDHDDQVDAASVAFNAVLLEPKPKHAGAWGRDEN
jgi:predicted phage terminase large subunit-like protein